MSSSVARRRPRQTRAGHRGKARVILGCRRSACQRGRARCAAARLAHVTTPSQPAEDLARIVESARRLGVELDEAEALQWLTRHGRRAAGGDVVVDAGTGVFGHRVSMLDFSPSDLAHFRRDRPLVELRRRPGGRDRAGALRFGGPVEDPDLSPATATTSSGSTSSPRPARRPAAILGRADARQGARHRAGRRPTGSSRSSSATTRSTSCATASRSSAGRRIALDAGRGRAGQHRAPSRRRRAGRRCTGTRWPPTRAGASSTGSSPTRCAAAGQRQQHARRHLGGARRHDHAARRLPGPLLPGGLPRGRVGADLLQAGPRTSPPTRSTTTSPSWRTRSTST